MHPAAALRGNGGGRVSSTEFEPAKIAEAPANTAATGLTDRVEIQAGDALQTLAGGWSDHIDLVSFEL